MSGFGRAAMGEAQAFAQNVAQGGDWQQAAGQAVSDLSEQVPTEQFARGGDEEGFSLDPADFQAAHGRQTAVGTVIEARTASLAEAGDIINRSFSGPDDQAHVISPVVIPHGAGRALLVPGVILGVLAVIGVLGGFVFGATFFGPHYWVALLLIAAFLWWRRSVVRVPEGSKALITKFGKLVQIAEPGRIRLFNPWKRISYIVNTTREYPFNAPISEAPTQQGVKASIDLFLQFRIEDPAEFIFVLGSVNGFQSKLQNAISEVTRSLIYAQRAEDIYDLVGESTHGMLESLNQQFLPAVRMTAVNITHAEPTSQEYRMDLAAPEMVRVAKEAYTYQYELKLKKEQNEGDLSKELAGLRETLSGINAEIAGYQAQMDTALERESHRAKAQAGQRLVEAESMAKANSALLEAQALDIRTMSAAGAPEILNYRFETEQLDRLQSVSDSLPRVVQIGEETDIDYLALAQRLVGGKDTALFSDEDMAGIRSRVDQIESRVEGRRAEIAELLAESEETAVPEPAAVIASETPDVPPATAAGTAGEVTGTETSTEEAR